MSEAIRFRRTEDGKRHRVAVFEGVDGYFQSVTRSCSGCTELGEYGSNINGHPWDDKAQCLRGFGCRECGHTGKRKVAYWIPFSWDEWAFAPTQLPDR